MSDPYSRLDPDEFHENTFPQSPPLRAQTTSLYDPHLPTSPVRMDPRRTPSPGHPLAGYHDDGYGRPHRTGTSGYAAGTHTMPDFPPEDRLSAQPTYSVEGLAHSYNRQGTPAYGNTPLAINPEEHQQAYYNDPYSSHGPDESYPLTQFNTNTPGGYDFEDDDPILHSGHPGVDEESSYFPSSAPTPQPQIKRWKTVKKVELYKGNLVLDCPVPKKLLALCPQREEREFTHMRYTAATCDPSEFLAQRFTLRQKLFAKPRHTELFIVVTMYNEDEVLFARTMAGVFKNINFLCSRTKSNTWGKDAWKKVVVCVVSDGRGKINPRTRSVLAGMGCYQEGIAKSSVNKKDVTAHIYEYTTQVGIELQDDMVKLIPGGRNGATCPVQMLFCLKEKNQKKINSHRWFFQAFGAVLDPNVCVLIDAGTRPGGSSIYHLWKAFEVNPKCAGACGEIKAMLGKGGRLLLNPLIATQNFEYKMSNILDKPLESVFGFISVLPGAFSAYRYIALQNDAAGEGPLEKYFKGEKMHGGDAGIFTANMYLAEDRILCFELVAKRKSAWVLQYVKSSNAETDVPDTMSELILQRRRWLNGSFFAAVYALVHAFDIWRSNHSLLRKLAFHVEFLYQTISMIFSWFAIGNFFLVFRILTVSLGEKEMNFAPGKILSIVFEWLYLAILITCFVLSLGNRPQGSNKFYMSMVIFWAIIMLYLMFAAVFISVRSVQKELRDNQGKLSLSSIFQNPLFLNLLVSLGSTYLLYFVASFMFFEPWHMFTSFAQYLLLSPSYINVLNVYAFCNTHDITWGTKGDDKAAPKLEGVKTSKEGKVDVNIPSDDKDLDAQYETEMAVLAVKFEPPPKTVDKEEKQVDYYKGVRSGVVLVWIFCNFALAATILNSGGLDRVTISPGEDASTEERKRATIYLSIVLWSVAGLSAFRFLGATWFLIVRMFRGV
ncbi:chitin synthase-domain-containing protein [Peziza echinospora]|nr:chitin synthase-domain-containing protein [Peziza echinospora]